MPESYGQIMVEEIADLVRLVYVACRQGEDGCCPPLPHTNTQHFQALYVLQHEPDTPITMSRLAEELLISKQQLSKLIGTMEGKGLVQREHNTANRRQVYVRIMPPGQQMLQETKTKLGQWLDREITLYTQEERLQMRESVRVFIRLLHKRLAISKTQTRSVQEDA